MVEFKNEVRECPVKYRKIYIISSILYRESNRRNIMDKLGINSVAELTKYAVREGLTPLES